MHIPSHILEQINAQADLVAIIRKHTVLKPAGKEFKGCCPFHGEKTPSFFVNPQNNLYYCFGCGVKGNAISFLVDFERLTFTEAVKELAQKTGIDLPKDDHSTQYPKTPTARLPVPPADLPTDTPNPSIPPSAPTNPPATPTQAQKNHDTNNHDTKGDLYQLLQAVSRFYQSMLHQYPKALAYFQKRGLSAQTIAHFELGYAPEGWQHLQQAFADDIEGLKIVGLIRQSQHGSWFNLFKDRVIFPIKNTQGQIVGFAGRALDDSVLPKYINSSDSVIFQKQQILYGLYESKKQRAKDWLVVEGYMDVISLFQAGILGAVAPMGTALHERQLAYLFKFNNTLTLSFDGDAAGQKAALRALQTAMPILDDSKSLRFLVLPDQNDPDSFVRQYGAPALQEHLQKALSLSDFLFWITSQKYDLKRAEDKAQFIAEIKQITALLPKGSSLRWWLNDDMFRRLRGTHFAKTTPKTAILPITPDIQLVLCIVFCPALPSVYSLQHLYQNTGLLTLDAQFGEHAPPLPTWQTLGIEGLQELLHNIQNLHAFLDIDDIPLDPKAIDARAHFITATLHNTTLQKTLSLHWRDFLHQCCTTNTDISVLFQELLCQSVIAFLQKQHQNCTTLMLSKLYKQRIFLLNQYDKTLKSQSNSTPI